VRYLHICFLLLMGNTGIASAAAISAVLKPGYAGDLTGLISRTSQGVQSDHYDGPIAPWNPPNFQTVVFVNYNVDGGVALVRTDVSRQDNSGTTKLALTTYSNMYFANSVSTGNATYLVNNRAYWEFVIDGNYDWEIRDTDPLIRRPVNRRTYEFVKVQGTSESTIFANSLGTGSLNPKGSAQIGSGVYRLYFHHFDSAIYNLTTGEVNSVDLDIYFTLKSEGAVVPEPSSLAVFGALGLSGLISRWRRKFRKK